VLLIRQKITMSQDGFLELQASTTASDKALEAPEVVSSLVLKL